VPPTPPDFSNSAKEPMPAALQLDGEADAAKPAAEDGDVEIERHGEGRTSAAARALPT
jgi:hypothetical protein